ncbi:glycosyltransferase family 2 protein [Comamonas faecalis]|uniref:Glycosyltransferase family 2 protein n=1 Tax=Comamonas faecalis TaxID=1387849 RepID=A0ABP7QFP1_9BURK
MLDVIVVNYNTAHLLQRMFDACDAAAQDMPLRYWVVDNASRDDSVQVLRRDHPNAFVQVNEKNVGFGRANNQMVEHLTGEYALLLNTDAFVAPTALQVAIDCLQRRPNVGAVGVRLTTEDGQLQPSCRYFPTPWNMFLQRTGLSRWFFGVQMVDDYSWDHQGERECDWVPGCFLLIRKKVIDQIGLFDPRYFLYFEEVDLCKRIQAAGWKVLYTGATSAVHLGGESAKTVAKITQSGRQISELQVESELLYVRKHHGLVGLWQHLALTHLADAITATKDLLKRRGWEIARAQFERGAALRRMCGLTRWGRVSTR